MQPRDAKPKQLNAILLISCAFPTPPRAACTSDATTPRVWLRCMALRFHAIRAAPSTRRTTRGEAWLSVAPHALLPTESARPTMTPAWRRRWSKGSTRACSARSGGPPAVRSRPRPLMAAVGMATAVAEMAAAMKAAAAVVTAATVAAAVTAAAKAAAVAVGSCRATLSRTSFTYPRRQVNGATNAARTFTPSARTLLLIHTIPAHTAPWQPHRLRPPAGNTVEELVHTPLPVPPSVQHPTYRYRYVRAPRHSHRRPVPDAPCLAILLTISPACNVPTFITPGAPPDLWPQCNRRHRAAEGAARRVRAVGDLIRLVPHTATTLGATYRQSSTRSTAHHACHSLCFRVSP